MLALFSFGFATIKAEKLPDGIMPQKRQVAGTGVSTSTTPETTSATSQTTDDPSTSETTATSDTPTTTTPTDTSSDTPATTTATPTSEQTSPTTTQPSPSTTTAAPSSTEDSSTAAPTTTSEDSSTTDATTTPTSTRQSTSDPSSTDNSSDASTTGDSSTPSSTDSPSSTDNPSSAQSSPTASADSTQTSDDSSQTSAASSRGSSQQSSTMMPTTIDVTTTNSDGSTYTSRLATSTLVAAAADNERSRTTSGPVSTGTGKSSNIVVIGTSTLNRSTLKHATTITSALVAEQTMPQTYTSYWTSDGTAYSSVITTGGVVTSTTGYATATVEPSLRNGGGDGTNLSTSSKKILGGVLGGVGGAILIGGIAFVCWRLWGKKHKPEPLPQEDEMLDSRDDSISREKRRGSNGMPLDGVGSEGDPDEVQGYRNPNGRVNAASNF
ncbi:hypothetical protein KC333_g1276 [Hortaea werneckii]|nr:hypothetical protein KC333_g1276 [Hortaea werneckii]KAI7314377.1 hypothetical protein KC326_g5081 [Hortaea werneckii]